MLQNIRLDPLTGSDFDVLAQLADTIWRAHYSSMISMAQIDFMLDGRYAPERLRGYIDSQDRWLWLLRVAGMPAGYCSCSLAEETDAIKLEQLYLLADYKGQGLGGRMLRHVEAKARALGRTRLFLSVNKGNTDSIAIYRKSGFVVREEAVFDIGNGYVMDDYVMEKRL
ncbi:MAG: GNAT family N-acetyltransferase [Lysobacteraceae bacterium]